jgi:hypothetical protein
MPLTLPPTGGGRGFPCRFNDLLTSWVPKYEQKKLSRQSHHLRVVLHVLHMP